jgi:hypothetical protein
LFELLDIKRLSKPLDPTGDLARAMERYASTPIDGDEPLPSEEPGEA